MIFSPFSHQRKSKRWSRLTRTRARIFHVSDFEKLENALYRKNFEGVGDYFSGLRGEKVKNKPRTTV